LHIVHVIYWLRIAGLENGVVNLVNGLNSEFHHSVVCIADVGPLAKRLRPDVAVIQLNTGNRGKWHTLWELVRVLRKLRPDIVHSRNWAAIDAIVAARCVRVPIVIHGEHGREAFDPDGQSRRRKWVRRMLSPFVDRFITVSDDLRQWLVSKIGIPYNKTTRIHNGVDTILFSANRREDGRRILQVPFPQVVIGTIGRLEPVKDHKTLLEAFASIDHFQYPSALVIVGDGSHRRVLEERAQHPDLAGRVFFLGERLDVPVLLNAFDIFVLSSIAEGISNTILEAMATELPVIATDTGGNSELVKDGVTGALFTVGDSSGLATILKSYLGDRQLRKAHGMAGRRRVEEEFPIEKTIEQYRELYLSLLRGS
jgi:sugar transferase (PEP-CTERM/EpsH1 system associated)